MTIQPSIPPGPFFWRPSTSFFSPRRGYCANISSRSEHAMEFQIESAVFTAILIGCAGYAALFIAPDESTMHAIQRIFYFHAPTAWAGMDAFAITFIANIAYLVTKRPKWDWIGVAAAEVGLVCTTVVLLTGPIWAHPVLGIWWTWDARLTST